MLFVEFLGFNRNFLFTANSLPSKKLEFDQGSVSGYIIDANQLISNNDDPMIIFQNINMPVSSILLTCQDDIPGSSESQIFFRGPGQEYSEIRSVVFALEGNDPVYLPATTKVNDLRFDLVGQPNIAITCETILVNPKIRFAISHIRVLGYLLAIVLLSLWFTYIPAYTQERASGWLYRNGHWPLCALLLIIGLIFEITITYDSAHYLWLTDLIRSGDWASWDVIRNPVFPLQLYLTQSLFGDSTNGIRVAMVLCLILFFLFISGLGIEALQLKLPRHRFLLRVAVFWFVVLDPIVFGYFHSLLTEFDAAILVVASSWLALKLYSEQFPSKRFWILVGCNFVLTLVAWFLKQPYLGAALFPFAISLGLKLLHKFSWKKLLYFSAIGTVSIVLVLVAQFLWTTFLISRGNPISKERQFLNVLGSSLETQRTEIQNANFVRFVVKEYLISINLLIPHTQTNEARAYDLSLVRGNENVIVAQRIYHSDLTSQTGLHHFSNTIRYPTELYSQPVWLNAIFQSRTGGSNLLFVVSGLLLPCAILYELVIWFRKKSLFSTTLLIILGASLLNAVAHNLSGAALDRYFFLGFPLHLLAILLVVGKILLPKQHLQD